MESVTVGGKTHPFNMTEAKYKLFLSQQELRISTTTKKWKMESIDINTSFVNKALMLFLKMEVY